MVHTPCTPPRRFVKPRKKLFTADPRDEMLFAPVLEIFGTLTSDLLGRRIRVGVGQTHMILHMDLWPGVNTFSKEHS